MLVTGPIDFFQARQRSLWIRLRVRGGIHILCVSSGQHALHEEIERDFVEAKTTFKWQSSKEGQLHREDSFNDWMFSRPLALRPIYWEISSDAYTYFQNGLWDGVEHRDIWCAPIPNSGLDRQRSQKNLGWSSTQAAEGSRWNQGLRKSWKQKENRNRLPKLVGL